MSRQLTGCLQNKTSFLGNPGYPVKRNKASAYGGGFILAGAEGFEPSTKVLETHVLPLHHAPKGNGMIIRKRHAVVKDKILFYGP